MRPYNRRPMPPSYDKGFLDLEAIHIQQAIQDAQSAGTVKTALRSTDVTAGSAALVSAGLTVPIASGDNWHVRWTLWLSSASLSTGGATLSFTFPSATRVSSTTRYNNSGGAGATVVGQRAHVLAGTSITLGTPVAQYDSSTNEAFIEVDLVLLGASAAGTLDLKFKAATTGESQTVLKSSALIAHKL